MATLSVLTIAADYLNKSPPISLIKDIFGFSIGDRHGTLSLKDKLESIVSGGVSGGAVDDGSGEDEPPPPPMEEFDWFLSPSSAYDNETDYWLDATFKNVRRVTTAAGFYEYVIYAAYEDRTIEVEEIVGAQVIKKHGNSTGSNLVNGLNARVYDNLGSLQVKLYWTWHGQ